MENSTKTILAVAGIGAVGYLLLRKKDKTALYGKENVRRYQARVGQVADTAKAYLVNTAGAFEATGLIAPTESGEWSEETQKASDGFTKLLRKAIDVINEDPKALADYNRKNGAFRFIQELTGNGISGTAEEVEEAFVKGAGRFAERSISKSDNWALMEAAVRFANMGKIRLTYPY